jgi:glycosyltransferase involved in cell wall biosynthesis
MSAGGEAALPDVSVVIPTYNRRERLPAVLQPLLSGDEAGEIVVVVDGSTDGSAELLEQLAREEPRLRPVVIENRGHHGARQAGADAATGEVILLLDDDVIPEPGLVAGHARRQGAHERLVLLGYMPVARAPRRPHEFARELYGREYERIVTGWERDPGSILSTLWSGNLSMRRADLIALGPALVNVVKGYHEDLDFGLCCLEAGLVGAFDRSLRATHRYERGPGGFVGDARSSGASLPVVHRRHPERLGPLSADFAYADLPAPVRALARAGIRVAPLRRLVRGAVAAAGTLRLFTLERLGAALLWRMEQGHAASAASAGPGR